MKKLVYGLGLTLAIAVAAQGLSGWIPGVGSVSLAILLGMLVANLCPLGERFQPGIKFSEKTVLSYAIALMGFKLQLQVIGRLGLPALLIVLSTMAVTLSAAFLIGKYLKYGSSFCAIMGAGNAVCGSSAIAAVAPVTGAREEEIGLSVGVVNLMGTLGIFTLPILGHVLHFSNLQSSFMIGGTLQAIGHVVAAGFSVNDQVGDLATLIKMMRVLMIGPVVVLASLAFSRPEAKAARKFYLPGFIVAFMVCSVLGSIFSHDQVLLPHLKHLAKYLLMVAMAGVGMKIRFKELLHQGPKALFFGVCIATVQLAFILVLVTLFLR
jgi:uncharacterized integral membrane protein (TIGR00698 family)